MTDVVDGSFEKCPEGLLEGENLLERAGATTEESEEVDFSSLPMLVWLKGDESYFNAFDLNADQTMQILGVKRSRLNQISGKELRVARRRDGRYIRPFYRKQDVEDYLEWTRSTITQKRSSEVVKEAADELANQADKIGEEFNALKSSLEFEFHDRFLQSFDSQKQHSESVFQRIQLQLATARQLLNHLESTHREDLANVFREFRKVFDTLQGVQVEQVQLHYLVKEILAQNQIEKHFLSDIVTEVKQLSENWNQFNLDNQERRGWPRTVFNLDTRKKSSPRFEAIQKEKLELTEPRKPVFTRKSKKS